MTIIKIGIPGVLPDNDVQYMTYILRVIQKIDATAEVTVVRGLRTYSYNITPSEPGLKAKLVSEIRLANEAIHVPIEFSRTLALSTTIHFDLL